MSKQVANGNASTADHGGTGVRYRGFMAGVLSGMCKLSVGHPFDTIKVRMQTATHGQFRGPWDCLVQTVRNEGPRAVFKGMAPPLSKLIACSSLHATGLMLVLILRSRMDVYGFNLSVFIPATNTEDGVTGPRSLNAFGHGVAGMMAGWTVSLVATPFEHVKARLQTQYHTISNPSLAQYKGPIDCAKQISTQHGVRKLWHGFQATLLFRSFFFFWWSSYDIFTRFLQKNTNMPTAAVNFWAGGTSAQVFWAVVYPVDAIKQRIMTDSLETGKRKYSNFGQAAVSVYREYGIKGMYRGFVPALLRAFPANAAALTTWEFAMRTLPAI